MAQAFNKARRMETRERLNDHMVTYKDWQKILETIKVCVRVLSLGGRLIAMYACMFVCICGTYQVSTPPPPLACSCQPRPNLLLSLLCFFFVVVFAAVIRVVILTPHAFPHPCPGLVVVLKLTLALTLALTLTLTLTL